jgi:16S rRNA (uracil1498-N3)-methyltransferase
VWSKIRNDIKVRIHRVHTHHALEPGSQITIGGRAAHYLGRVLRLAVGDVIVLFNGDGHDYVAELVRAGKNELSLSLTSRLPATREPGIRITVVQAISRGERMDQTLQKCTELGTAGFQPLLSERVEVKLNADKLLKRVEHWQGVVISACEQSGRAVIPEVLDPVSFHEWIATNKDDCRLLLAPGAEKSLARVEFSGQVQLAVGPEGGFSESELELAAAHGVVAVSLGPRVLRTETAAPAAVAVIQALAGDLG